MKLNVTSELKRLGGGIDGIGEVIELDTKAVTEVGEFEGYAAVFNNVDQGGDIIVPGAFTKSLQNRPIERVRMLMHHNSQIPVGVYMEAREDERGLFVKGRFLTDVQAAREGLALVRAKALDGLSIGYRTMDAEYDRTLGVRRLLEVDLLEISHVTFAMNLLAQVTSVKESGQIPDIRTLERWLKRDAGLSASQAKALLADGYKAIQDARDAGTDGDEAESLKQLAALIRG